MKAPKTIALAFGLASLALGLTSCDTANAGGRRRVTESELCASTESGVWQSTPWRQEGCPWVAYPGESTLVFAHDLGRRPRSVQIYISFVQEGDAATLASGDAGQVRQVTDSEVAIKNGTEQKFFVRLVLQ